MGITETTIIYGIIGVVVAAALWMSGSSSGPARVGLFALHVALWPFFAPILLARSGGAGPQPPVEATAAVKHDPRLRQVEEQLGAATAGLDGFADELLGPQMARLRNLTGSLAGMSRRLAEMDELLATREFDEERVREVLDAADDEVRIESVQARLRNIERLQEMRRSLSADYERAILKIEEISSQVSLLRFADHPEREVGELVEDIAATVEGLSEGLLSK